MAMRVMQCHGGAVDHFREGVLRPPVPGEENIKSDAVRPESYEPEGRASPDHAHPSWAGSLKALLDEQDGIALFREFLVQEGCSDVIDFWLACSGFWLAYCSTLSCSSTSMEMLEDKRRLKLAKAIYKKYIISGGVVAKKIKPLTKSSIRERIRLTQLDSTLFQLAKQEVQKSMELEAYPLFLKSNIFLRCRQETCTEQEHHKHQLNIHTQETANSKEEINHSEEEHQDSLALETGNNKQEINRPIQEAESGKKELKHKRENGKQEVPRLSSRLVEETKWVEPEISSANHKRLEHHNDGYKVKYRMIQGCVRADAHKTFFLHKHSMHRMPEPCEFAADLISRLELVKGRENRRLVEDHLQTICMEPDDAMVSTASCMCPTHFFPTHHSSSHLSAQHSSVIPEIIMDEPEHGQRGIRTHSWCSSTTHSHTCPNYSDTWCHGNLARTNQSEALGYSSRRTCVCESVTVAYYFCGEPIPYRTMVKGAVITLGLFRELLSKKGHYRFFFKKASDEFECGVVYEEVREDHSVLPMFEGRITGKVEKIY
ncbi:axin-1-like isoform X2 [Silurus meridionalis]|uniref:axin-1-like isoform X2 n=1 Tax=Silurus meridionalis TaxID=175797 RepID=UPI001EEACB3C|nr:axin-1-like isoform X2 [Silurus meridionalis]